MSDISTQQSTADTYTMGYAEEFQVLLRRRSASKDAALLLPLIKPGMRVLDFGCGPGTISVGLASAADPGELHGIDTEESQIKIAQAAAQAGEHTNAHFHVGSVTELPFEDNSFDVAHCNAVLMHVPDTVGSLSEVYRVLKPGGILSSREMIVASSFFEPDIGGGFEGFGQLLAANGGHPAMGKELKRHVLEAGFSEADMALMFESFITPDDIAFLHGFAKGWVFAPSTIEAFLQSGIATQEEVNTWSESLDTWRNDPSSLGAFAWGQVIARK